MTLLINQAEVDLTLEHEKTVADLYQSLEAWATGEGHEVLGLLIDGVAPGPLELARPLAGVACVELETVPRGSGEAARLSVVLEVLELAHRAAKSGNVAVLADLRSEFPSIRSTLLPLARRAGLAAERPLAAVDGAWDSPAGLALALEPLHELTARLLRRQSDPRSAHAELLERLGRLLLNAANLPILWQKGQDREALDLVLELISTLEELDTLQPLLRRDDSSWKAFRAELQPFLVEIEQALQAQDFVLLGDLIEYEVAPRLEHERARQSANFDLDPSKRLP